MKITVQPIGDQIYLDMEKADLGALETSSMKIGMEWATIKGLGKEVQNKELKLGSKVFVKSWAIDVILYEGNDYYFTSEARKGIVAIIK